MSLLDEVLLLDIYPARELPIPGVTSEMILELITSRSKNVVSKEALIERALASNARVILTLGAGDIDQLVAPLRKALMSKYQITVA